MISYAGVIAEDIIVQPDLIASRYTNGKPSNLEDKTKILAFLYFSLKTSLLVIAPVKNTLSKRFGFN